METRSHREPTATVGLGTVHLGGTAERALAAGAAFLVSPFQVPECARSPTGPAGCSWRRADADRAAGLGPGGVAKLLPAHVGGLAYLRSLRSAPPGARIMATCGVTLESAAEWRRRARSP